MLYFLLEGDYIGKVEDGDRLIVKRDASGPLSTCTEATVLEVKTQRKDFITVTLNGNSVQVPEGVYMKMNSISFEAKMDEDDIVDEKVPAIKARAAGNYPVIAYPFFLRDASGAFTSNYTLPIGTRVVMKIEQTRVGTGNQCEPRSSILEQTIICSDTYANIEEFFSNENLQTIIEQNAVVSPADINNVYIPTASQSSGLPSGANSGSNGRSSITNIFGSTATSPTSTNYYRLHEDTRVHLLIVITYLCQVRKGVRPEAQEVIHK